MPFLAEGISVNVTLIFSGQMDPDRGPKPDLSRSVVFVRVDTISGQNRLLANCAAGPIVANAHAWLYLGRRQRSIGPRVARSSAVVGTTLLYVTGWSYTREHYGQASWRIKVVFDQGDHRHRVCRLEGGRRAVQLLELASRKPGRIAPLPNETGHAAAAYETKRDKRSGRLRHGDFRRRLA